jgi:very-short-patch-repair endonuclease
MDGYLPAPTRQSVAPYRAAGRFWHLDGCDFDITEILTTADLRPGADGATIHRTKDVPARDVTVVQSLPVTTVHRTLVDLGAVCDLEVVELAVESALRRRITTVPRLERHLAASSQRGRRGPKTLRVVLRRRGDRPPTDSHLETRFLQFLRRHGFPEPDRQERIYGDDGLIARVDFIYVERNLIVEVDSRTHHTRQLDWERDLRRRNALTSRGRRVLHVTESRLRSDPEGLAGELRRAFDLTSF